MVPRGGTSSCARAVYARSAFTAALRAASSSGGAKWIRKWVVVRVRHDALGSICAPPGTVTARSESATKPGRSQSLRGIGRGEGPEVGFESVGDTLSVRLLILGGAERGLLRWYDDERALAQDCRHPGGTD